MPGQKLELTDLAATRRLFALADCAGHRRACGGIGCEGGLR